MDDHNDSRLAPWRPPKSPLAPYRLAKLANALGVSTPLPATTSYLSRSFSDSPTSLDHARRSPTPMGFSPHSPAPPTSRFLLHVIPPLHLPHDSDAPDDDALRPPPPNAPGYHTQFRRGTLLPVHSTLQAQLGAIAKEYALPSSTGLVLYLVTSPQSPSSDSLDEPGPRLSEDIWKHLWTRVLRVEQRDEGPSRSPTPQSAPFILRLAPAARSTPFLAQEQSTSLRPLFQHPAEPLPPLPNAPQPTYPTATAPSTPSTASDRQSNNKSAPPSVSHSEPGTPDTSVDESGLRANFLDLPGLNSPSLIPILAKVEFDIDRRRAAWYEPWIRSRAANHAKRAGSRKGSIQQDDEVRVHTPIELLTGKAKKQDPFGRLAEAKQIQPQPGVEQEVQEVQADSALEESEEEQEEEQVRDDGAYTRLSESPDEIDSESDSEVEEDFNEEATARVSAALTERNDPLADVFGTDEDTWAEIHAENNEPVRHDDPNIVNLALTAAELSALPSDPEDGLDDENKSTKAEDDVLEMLDMMAKPNLAITIPSPEKEKDANKRSSLNSINGSRKIPPPLVLKPKDQQLVSPAILSAADTSVSTPRLAYRSGTPDQSGSEHGDDLVDMDELDQFSARIRSPGESDKRGGAVFDDLDLGLDPTEDFDDNDPNDRRRSQYIMSAQLDAIEKTMASLSPRFMTTSLEEEQSLSFNSATLSPSTPANLTLSPGRSFDFLPPPSPRLPKHPDPPEEAETSFGQSWPAVPFSSIKDRDTLVATGTNSNIPPSPPRLALNGISTSAPKSYMPSNPTENVGISESDSRKRELAETEAIYNPPNGLNNRGTMDSPVIPLSPDPFGRHPSSPEPPEFRVSGAQWDTMTIGKGGADMMTAQPPAQGRARAATISRFSTDSVKGDIEPVVAPKSSNRATLISVKTIKKLWRKSNKSANQAPAEAAPAVPPAPASSTAPSSASSSTFPSPAPPPMRPERPSQDELYLPDGDLPPSLGRLPPNGPPAQEQPYGGRRSLDQQAQPPMGRVSPIPPPPLPAHGQMLEQGYAGRRSLDQQHAPPMGRVSPNPPQFHEQGYGGRRSIEQQQQQQQQPPPMPMGRVSPNPQAPDAGRRSLEQHNGPTRPSLDRLNMLPPPPQGNMGRLSPQLMGPPGSRPSIEQMPPGARMSLEQHGRRPTQEQYSLHQFAYPQQPGQQQQQPQQQQLQPQNPQQQQQLQPQNSQQQQQQQVQQQQQHQQQFFAPPPPPQQYAVPPQQMQQQQQRVAPPTQPYQQLNIPTYPGRNPNPPPIITPYMQASKAQTSLDRLHFDQESPYPTHRALPSLRNSPRAPSPTALPAIPEGGNNGGPGSGTGPSAGSSRAPITRWKSAASASSSSSSHSAMSAEQRASLDRASTTGSARSSNGSSGGGGGGGPARRPSAATMYSTAASSTRTSVTSPDPTQFGKPTNGAGGLDYRTSQRSRMTTSSTDSSYSPPQRQVSLGQRSSSPPRSMASSRDSEGSRPSFDASQFEFVSPKGASLSYPFNGLDHQ